MGTMSGERDILMTQTMSDIIVRAERGVVIPARLDSPRRTIVGRWPAMTVHHPIVPGVQFKDIPGFPSYCVGDDGSVVSWYRSREWRWLKSGPSGRYGHRAVNIRREDKLVTCRVHRLVLMTFVGPCPPGMEACHGDGDPANNRLDNLRWDTKKANAQDRIRHGRGASGVGNGRAKLTEADVLTIRHLVRSGMSQVAIGQRYEVTAQQVGKIANGRSWKHLKETR